ncbi:MAG: hypothetical protein KKB50_16225 [Planctomycetes bacterium]|nr:hypothetical protein [Planctomycetota bacterium]
MSAAQPTLSYDEWVKYVFDRLVEDVPWYVDEQARRFNERKDADAGRFGSVIRSVTGKHGAPSVVLHSIRGS